MGTFYLNTMIRIPTKTHGSHPESIPEKEPLAGDDYVKYENTNNTAVTILPAQTKGSKSTKIVCSILVGCLLVMSIVGTVVYFTVIKDKYQDNPATNTTVAWTTTTTSTTTTTTTAATTPSPWTSWSRCSEECSSSLNPNDLKCPTKRRYRTKQGRTEIDTTDCNCVQCPFRYGTQWYTDGCGGSHNCAKISARYCQMVTPSGRVVHDSRTEKYYDKGLYKCQGPWKDTSYSHWNRYCGRNCPGSCKHFSIGCP